jgi:L-iditol 2-dehydrogenase
MEDTPQHNADVCMGTAAYIHGAGDIRIGNYDAQPAKPGWSLVDIASVGVCGSDLHYYKDGGIGSAAIQEPFIPGHEFSAYLCADIESLSLNRGQLVAVDPALPCHQCEWCIKGHHNLCPNVIFIGAPPYHGALTQKLAVPVEGIVPLPECITADQAAMLEPLGVCIHAIDLARPRLLESVAVLGCGCIGLGIIQLLKQSGCGTIIAIDPQAHRHQAATTHGADMGAESIEAVLDHTSGRGCDLVIEATNSPFGMAHAIKAASIGSRVVLVGIPDGNQYAAMDAADMRRKGLKIKMSRRMGNVYSRAIELVAQKKVDVDAIVSHRFTLEESATAFQLQAADTEGLIKSIIYPNAEA